MQAILSGRFPAVKIYGLFIARRALENPFEAFDLNDLDF
jgi:hypothetical protein